MDVTQPGSGHVAKLVFVTGFVFLANFSIFPGLDFSPRLSDLVCGVLTVLAFIRLFRGGLPRLAFFLAWVVVLYFLTWVAVGLQVRDFSTVAAAIRLIVGAGAGLYLSAVLARDTTLVEPFAKGLASGAVLVALIALGQNFHLSPLFFEVVPSSAKQWWDFERQLRVSGIWEHPNGLAHAQMIGASAALALAAVRRSTVLGFGLFVFIVLSTYVATETRAILLIAVALFVLYLLVVRNTSFRVAGAIALVLMFTVGPFVAPEVLGERWFQNVARGASLGENTAERIYTIYRSLEFLTENPLGYGVTGRLQLLIRELGIPASHNSYVSIGLSFGILPMFILIGSFLKVIPGLLNKTGVAAVILFPVCSIFMSYFFEDAVYSPTFAVMTPLLLMTGHLLAQAGKATPAQPRPPASLQDRRRSFAGAG